MNVADLVVSRLVRAGARAIFGMPGGGSTLDIIAAARDHGIRFVLSHTETAGAIMAAAQAEITGAPGVCLSTLGPGVSSIANGVAHAWLDRVPLVVLTDVMEPAARARYEHQNLSHGALLGPITKFTSELTATGTQALLEEALARALADPPGPVHLDCAPSTMSADAESPIADSRERFADSGERIANSRERVADTGERTAESGSRAAAFLSPAARRLLGNARRPLVIAGLGTRRCDDAAALRRMCDRHGVPALVTYKAKGVIGDGHASYAGLFTLSEIEKPLVERADVLLTVGLDPVELLPRPWPWAHPILHCSRWPMAGEQMPAGESAIGDLAGILDQIDRCLPATSDWTAAEIGAHRERQRAAVMAEARGFAPGRAVAAIADATATVRHITVDAGAHMFPAMALIPADVPGRILISNGLSTMGYALPAAIGAALLAPADPVVAITGDAGLLLCLGELRTAAREGVRVVVIVFADGELSLIRVKQDRRGLDPDGVRIGDVDWPRAAGALGLRAFRACDEPALREQLADALAADGPSLIDARVDPAAYGRMLQTLRG